MRGSVNVTCRFPRPKGVNEKYSKSTWKNIMSDKLAKGGTDLPEVILPVKLE